MMKKYPVGTKFLDKYINKRKLGKGAFGDVFLVEDEEGQLMALKMIDRKKIEGENEDMVEYLQGEIDCMKDMNCPHLVKLYDFEKDDDNYYMLMEYCDGGDLVNQQMTFKNKVFPLETIVEYLSQVIKGLEQLHKNNYLHRDIKPQNVLLKIENGKKIIKITDFGFAKKASNLTGTVLGTESYMSPEIYRCGADEVEGEGDIYGYEVDMWAFGVLFYYLLNQAIPFEINPYWSLEEKCKELTKQGENFSYRKSVMATRRKLEENCTDDMENLFKKIFCIELDRRITFAGIRIHPVFKKYFPSASLESQILYMNKIESKRLKKKSMISDLPGKLKDIQKKSIVSFGLPSIPQKRDYSTERQIIELELEEIDFLWDIMKQLTSWQHTIGMAKTAMICFNLTKYYIFLLKKFLKSFNQNKYSSRHKEKKSLAWRELFSDQSFILNKKSYAEKLGKASKTLETLHCQCEQYMPEIRKINKHFEACFTMQIADDDPEKDSFQTCYRQSTNIMYSSIKAELKSNKVIELYFTLCVVCICHVYSDFYESPDKKADIFREYLQQEKDFPIFSYGGLMVYLRKSSKESILKLTQRIILECMNA